MSEKARMKQESFIIEEDSSPRKKIVRQDRISVSPQKCYMILNDLRLEVLNFSSFGLAIVGTEQMVPVINGFFEDGEGLMASIVFNDLEIQRLRLKLARTEKHPQSVFNDYIFGFEAVGEAVAVDCIAALEVADDIITQSKNAFALASMIPNDFKLLVFEMKEWILQLKEKIDQLEKNAPRDNAVEHSEFRQTVTGAISDYLGQVIPAKYQIIPQLIAGKDEKVVAACTQFIRQQVGNLVYGAPFAYRAYSKPRGYAGDYEMMNHLYRDEVIGASLFDQCLHKYFIDEPAGQAVKNRGFYLLEQIKQTVQRSKKDTIKILAVASGPAMEQQLFLREAAKYAGKRIEFVCVDQDEESLKHAQKQILGAERFIKSGHQFRFMNLAIKNILTRGLPETGFDLVYSAGLFDYFTDPVSQMAAVKLFEGVAPGGSLIIGNFSTNNPCVPFMEMVLDWHLIYRTPEQLMKLYGGLSSQTVIESESLGVNLFAVIKKE